MRHRPAAFATGYGYGDGYSIRDPRLRAAPFRTPLAALDRGKTVGTRRSRAGAPDRFCGPQRRQPFSRRLRLNEIGEAASATAGERRDVHEVVVERFAGLMGYEPRGQMRGTALPTSVLPPV
jgi:hypothetical protein